MDIRRETVVEIDYTLTSDAGEVLDSSEGRSPLTYLHGAGNIIPGLEQALEGRSAGDAVDVRISPENAYGEHDPNLLQEVPRSAFEGVDSLEVGMQFEAGTEDGRHMLVTVSALGEETVTIDGNHPMAGVPLNFAVLVRSVRAATDAERSAGRAG